MGEIHTAADAREHGTGRTANTMSGERLRETGYGTGSSQRELFFLLIIFTVGFRDGSETEADTNRRSCRSLSYPNVYFRDASHFMPASRS